MLSNSRNQPTRQIPASTKWIRRTLDPLGCSMRFHNQPNLDEAFKTNHLPTTYYYAKTYCSNLDRLPYRELRIQSETDRQPLLRQPTNPIDSDNQEDKESPVEKPVSTDDSAFVEARILITATRGSLVAVAGARHLDK